MESEILFDLNSMPRTYSTSCLDFNSIWRTYLSPITNLDPDSRLRLRLLILIDCDSLLRIRLLHYSTPKLVAMRRVWIIFALELWIRLRVDIEQVHVKLFLFYDSHQVRYLLHSKWVRSKKYNCSYELSYYCINNLLLIGGATTPLPPAHRSPQ